MSLKKTATWTTSDGKNHPDHKTAGAHQKYLDRLQRLRAAYAKFKGASLDSGEEVVAEFIAKHGDAFVEALTPPSGRKPRTPKAVAANA